MKHPSLEVVVIYNEERTPLPEFLQYITNGLFATPTDGFWRQHDNVFHFPRLAALKSEEAQLAMDAASIGVQLLEAGDNVSAVDIANHVDSFLSIVSNARIEAQKHLWELVDRHERQEESLRLPGSSVRERN